jgi:hypothetical protein
MNGQNSFMESHNLLILIFRFLFVIIIIKGSEDHGPSDHDRDPAKPDRDEDIQERFVLLKRNDDEHYPYYTIRAQHGYTERRIKAQRLLFPQLQILLDFTAHPNSKTLYNRIKKELKAKNVVFDHTNIDLEDAEIDEQELIDKMKVINDLKYKV